MNFAIKIRNATKLVSLFRFGARSCTHSTRDAPIVHRVGDDMIGFLLDRYNKFRFSESDSVLKKHLTLEMFDNLKNLKTPKYSATLLDCIQSGLDNLQAKTGIFAPDAEAYTVFAGLFDPVLADLHNFKPDSTHPASDYGDYQTLGELDPKGLFILSTRIRVVRNIEGFPLAPLMTRDNYNKTEALVRNVLSRLDGELEGFYNDETSTLPHMRLMWLDQNLYGRPTKEMKDGNIGRFYPIGRALYHTPMNKFSVQVNADDHLRIVSMQDGGYIGDVYRRLLNGLEQIGKKLKFTTNDRLGFITCNPRNLGTGLRASVHIRLRNLPSHSNLFQGILDKYNLQVRGTRGKGTPVLRSIYDISNKFSLGVTEIESVNALCKGLEEIMRYEKTVKLLEDGEVLKWT